MKVILYSLVMICAVLVSCTNNDFMDLYPQEQITEPTYFTTSNDLKLYANQFYSSLPVEFSANDANSDNQVPKTQNSFLSGIYIVPATGGGWSASDWSSIRACNLFLNRYKRAQTADTTLYAGEVQFFRALFYWQKVVSFGDVPILTSDLTDISPELYGNRKNRKEVMNFVLNDLNLAVNKLPEATEAGRINKYVALALKSRICLWEGTFRKYHKLGDEVLFLQESAKASKQIIDSRKYALYSTGNFTKDYYNLFLQPDLTKNPESILCKVYINGILSNGFSRSGTNNNGWSKDFVDSYLCDDGLPIALSPKYKGDETAENEAANRDPRYAQTVATPGYVMSFLSDGSKQIMTLPNIGSALTSTGYQISKGMSPDQQYWSANKDDLDRFIFRYAEVLLNYAEAKAELGELNQGVVDESINKLRQRVGMPNMILTSLVQDPKSPFPSLGLPLQEIRRERRIELSGDGFRFNDILRWAAGKLIENPYTMLGMKLTPEYRTKFTATQIKNVTINSNNYLQVYSATTRTWNDKMYLYPLPIDQITLNPNLKQNPGWAN